VRSRGDDCVCKSACSHDDCWFAYPAERPHKHSASALAFFLLRFDILKVGYRFVPPKGRHKPHSASALTSPMKLSKSVPLQEWQLIWLVPP